jgi:hypothetical protein
MVYRWIITLVLVMWHWEATSSSAHHAAAARDHLETFGANAPTVFWINLPGNHERREHTKRLLHRSGFLHHVRVDAVAPGTDSFALAQLEKPCKRNTDKDIAVILSHLRAIHAAIYHDPQQDHPYALILEDDVKFLFALNFTALVQSAPPSFGILQLTTSSPDAISSLWTLAQAKEPTFWQLASWRDTTRNRKEYLYWSAQAYIVQKAVIKQAIDFVVSTVNHTSSSGSSSLSFRILNSFFPEKCPFTRERPCVLSNCLFADTYIYSLGKPTYVSTVPLVTGSKVGLNSTIHQVQVDSHREGFSAIRRVYATAKDCLVSCKPRVDKMLSMSICSSCRLPAFLLRPLL